MGVPEPNASGMGPAGGGGEAVPETEPGHTAQVPVHHAYSHQAKTIKLRCLIPEIYTQVSLVPDVIPLVPPLACASESFPA